MFSLCDFLQVQRNSFVTMLITIYVVQRVGDLSIADGSRLSDHIGREHAPLLGLVGIILSTVLFGFSHSLWALVLRY